MKYNYRKEEKFTDRYINPNELHKFLNTNYKEHITLLGYSTLDLPIYKLVLGKGNIKVLAWTQMHGNESTATLAMLDIIKFYFENSEESKIIFQDIELHLILMLNPDGSLIWERRNALGVDINRDYVKESSIEMHILKTVLKSQDFNFALNMHDQRTIYNVDKTDYPATLSFLAPVFDKDKSINYSRSMAMGLIGRVYDKMTPILPNQMALFDDEYNPISSGDNIQKLDIPTVLIEAGHYQNDYNRSQVRAFYYHACLHFFNEMKTLNLDNYIKDYLKIPKNATDFLDVIIYNCKILNNEKEFNIDIGIQYKEKVIDNVLRFFPYIEEIGDLNSRKGWIILKDYELDLDNTYVNLKIEQPADELLKILDIKIQL